MAFSFMFVAPKQLSWRSKTPPVVSIASGVRCEAAAAAIVVPPEKEALVEKLQYQAEVSRLLDLIVHSLYSHKEVFLRELVSNASDALDKVRFLSDTDPSLVEPDINLEIRIKPDLESGTITISYASSILNTPFVVSDASSNGSASKVTFRYVEFCSRHGMQALVLKFITLKLMLNFTPTLVVHFFWDSYERYSFVPGVLSLLLPLYVFSFSWSLVFAFSSLMSFSIASIWN